MKKKVYIDQGNSQTKILINADVFVFSNERILSSEFKNFCEAQNLSECQIFYSSVNTVAFEQLTSYVNQNEFIDIKKIIEEQKIIDFSQISGMGSDRKLSLFGAMNYFSAPFASIDFGTAITLNILDKKDICLGGFIALGISSQAKALNQLTSALPLVQIQNTTFPAKNTEDAIRLGIQTMLKATIKEMICQLNAMQISQIAITGGDAELSLAYFEDEIFDIHYDKNLNLNGIKLLLEKNINKI